MFSSTKTLFAIIIAFFVLESTASAQQEIVTISPSTPAPGEQITLTYHPSAAEAIIKSPDSLQLVLSFAPYLYGEPNQFEAQKTKNGWQTSFELSESFKFASFYFESPDTIDKNTDGHHYEFFAYRDEKPVKDAYMMKAFSLAERYNNVPDSVLNEMKVELYQQELDHHPNNWDAQLAILKHRYDQDGADKKAIQTEAIPVIKQKLAENSTSHMHVSEVKNDFKDFGKKAMGDSLESKLIERHPGSDLAMQELYRSRQNVESEEKKANILLEYVNADYDRSMINKYHTQSAYEQLFTYYAKQDSMDRAKEMIANWIAPDEPLLANEIVSEKYNQAAEIMLEHTDWYDLAQSYAEKAFAKTDDEPAANTITTTGQVVRQMSDQRSAEYKNSRKSDILDTMGEIYLTQQKYDKAEEMLTKAAKLGELESTQTLTAELYMQTDRPKQAFDIYWDLLMEKPTNETFRDKLEQSYVAYNGSKKGFAEKTNKLDEAWQKQMVKKFNSERIDEKAPSLTQITDLQGNPIDSDKLKNNVIVVDFWATWCGPCISAFPYLQKVYDTYKDNPNVTFVVLNSAWNNTIKDARTWEQENDYTFPLYFDKDSKVTDKFGVRGIPTTFIIDQKGNIQFKKVGFEGEKMEPKMKLKIDLLLDENKPSSSSSPK